MFLNYNKKYKETNKKFTLDGCLVGDLGEILAMEQYQIKLFNKVEKKYDAITEYDQKKSNIKSNKNNNA